MPSYRQPIGPQRPQGSALFTDEIAARAGFSSFSGYGATFHVDFTPVVTKLKLALDCYSVEIQRRATYNALNAVCDPLLTATRRHVRDQSGAKYGRVMKAIKAKRAHPNNLRYTIQAQDGPMKLSEFARGLRPGQGDPSASPWNKTRRFHGAFTIRFRSGAVEIVKRIGRHNKAGKIRVLFGPILPREMLRPHSPSLQEIADVVPLKLVPRLLHELEQAQIRAKAESGT